MLNDIVRKKNYYWKWGLCFLKEFMICMNWQFQVMRQTKNSTVRWLQVTECSDCFKDMNLLIALKNQTKLKNTCDCYTASILWSISRHSMICYHIVTVIPIKFLKGISEQGAMNTLNDHELNTGHKMY